MLWAAPIATLVSEEESMRIFATIVGIWALVLIGGSEASAQSQWEASCSTDRMSDKKDCTITAKADAGRPTFEFILITYSVANKAFAIGSGEIGDRARVRVDSNAPVSMSGCHQYICPLFPQPSAALLQQMRSGSTALVEFTSVRGKTVGPLAISLSGFDAAYQRAIALQQGR